MDPTSNAVLWSRRGAHAVLIVVMSVLAGVTLFAYFLGRAIKPDPKPPLAAAWLGIADVLAGDGHPGVEDGDAARARFSDLFGVAAAPDGAVFVSDAGDAQRIRRIDPEGLVTTVAGSVAGFRDGVGVDAQFDTPSGIALGPDAAVYVADTGNNAIRRVTAAGVVSTVAGGGTAGFRDGVVLDAEFNGPVGVAVEPGGRILVADTYNDRIRAIDRGGHVTTLAGSGKRGYQDGPALEAAFDTPTALAVDADGHIFVADSGNGVIRRLDRAGQVTTVEALPDGGGLVRPLGIATGAAGALYVTDDRGRVLELVPGVGARVVAGSRPGFANGRGPDARMRGLAGIAVTGPGQLVVADPHNALVRLITADGQGDLRPPAPPTLHPEFDVERFALQPLLWPADPMDGPHEITGTLGEARGSEHAGRFHAGLDVQAPEGTAVRVVREGVVTTPVSVTDVGTLNESLRIGPITYVHLRVGRTRSNDPFNDPRFIVSRDDRGRVEHIRVKRGARFVTGEAIGTVNPFNHVHLNVGWPGEEINPLRFRLVRFVDTVSPRIERILLFTEEGQPVVGSRRGPIVVDRPVQVVVDAWDQADGNRAYRRLGLYELGYQVLTQDLMPVPGFEQPRYTIRFDRLTTDPGAAGLVYASGSGIPFYGTRSTHFLYVVTNSLEAGRASAGVWDPTGLGPGDYVIRVFARDIVGNEAMGRRDLPIRITHDS